MADKPAPPGKMVCPWWLCFTFDNPLRRLVQNPSAILAPHVHPGDTALDIGPGMGFFTIPLARLVGPSGHVTAIDVQPEMLSALAQRAARAGVSERIYRFLATGDSLGEHDPADFILAFWMLHEVPDQRRFLGQVRALLKPRGRFMLVEPIVHVSSRRFARTLQTAREVGFSVVEHRGILISRGALLSLLADDP